MAAWLVFGLATETLLKLQVRLHKDIDGSPLAGAICAFTGPLLFHVFTLWCMVLRTHTHRHTHTLLRRNKSTVFAPARGAA